MKKSIVENQDDDEKEQTATTRDRRRFKGTTKRSKTAMENFFSVFENNLWPFFDAKTAFRNRTRARWSVLCLVRFTSIIRTSFFSFLLFRALVSLLLLLLHTWIENDVDLKRLLGLIRWRQYTISIAWPSVFFPYSILSSFICIADKTNVIISRTLASDTLSFARTKLLGSK